MATRVLSLLLALFLSRDVAAADTSGGSTKCRHVKELYKSEDCCGAPEKKVGYQIVPNPSTRMTGTNPCADKKKVTQPHMNNKDCFKNAVRKAGEQSGADVTKGYEGGIDTNVTAINVPYFKTALCPVNVHWHLGAEHRSEGQFDEQGTSPELAGYPAPQDNNPDAGRRLAAARYGFACNKYKKNDSRFDSYTWKHCVDMHVGETYEVHWPHSSLGACGTPYQYQYPFYDGVFCGAGDTFDEVLKNLSAQDVASNVGVQGQVFTIINDEQYYYPDLARGMIVDKSNNMGMDVAAYTGSTTGTTRNNQECSAYTPITWQVDRKCHFISASSFDKMCADMKQMRDDMTGDLHPHGARELVWTNLTADNHVDLNAR